MSSEAKPRNGRVRQSTSRFDTSTTMHTTVLDGGAQSTDGENDVSAPSAYVVGAPAFPFEWFKHALAELKKKKTLPRRIDRSVWSNKLFPLSTHDLATTFQFLNLANPDRSPTAKLDQLVSALGTDEWKSCFSEILFTAYASIWARESNRTSAGELFQVFKDVYGVAAEDSRKAVAFFVHATRDAGISEGAFRSSTRNGPRNARQAKTSERTTIAQALIERLPPFDPEWSEDLKLAWFSSFKQLLDLT